MIKNKKYKVIQFVKGMETVTNLYKLCASLFTLLIYSLHILKRSTIAKRELDLNKLCPSNGSFQAKGLFYQIKLKFSSLFPFSV